MCLYSYKGRVFQEITEKWAIFGASFQRPGFFFKVHCNVLISFLWRQGASRKYNKMSDFLERSCKDQVSFKRTLECAYIFLMETGCFKKKQWNERFLSGISKTRFLLKVHCNALISFWSRQGVSRKNSEMSDF